MQIITPQKIGALPSARQSTLLILCAIGFLLSMPAAYSQGQTVETGLVKLPDASIEYFNRGEGEPIVLPPGSTLTVGYLDGLAEALATAGYRVVGINFPGSGKSTGASTGVTLNNYADDVAGIIKSLNLGPVHLAGNDFGNRVARTDQEEFYQLLTYRDDVDLEERLAHWERFYNLSRPLGAFNGKAPYETLREKL
jgi:hypothetical protein